MTEDFDPSKNTLKEQEKNALLEDFFSLNSNLEIKLLNELEEKLENYLDDYGEDERIECCLYLLDAMAAYSSGASYDEVNTIAAPIFLYLSNILSWDFYDIRLFTWCSAFAGTFGEAYQLSERCLTEVEKHKQENLYPFIKSAVYSNLLGRLVSFKYREATLHRTDNYQDRQAEIDAIFASYFDGVQQYTAITGDTAQRDVAIFQKSLYTGDLALTTEVLQKMEKEHGHLFYETAVRLLDVYLPYLN